MAAISAARNRLGEGETSRADRHAVEAAGADVERLARRRRDRLQRRPQIGRLRLRVGRHAQDRGDRARAGADRRPVERRAGVVKPHRLGEDQPAGAANPPAVAKARRDVGLAEREAAEHRRFDDQQRRVGGDLGVEPPLEPGRLEQQRLLRRPGQRAARLDAKAGFDPHRLALAAVDLLRRLGGDDARASRPTADRRSRGRRPPCRRRC